MDIEKRKLIVGISGIDPRDERLIEIVFRHSQYNPIEFELQQRLELQTCEVLLVNPMTPEGLKALARLRSSARQLPVVSVVPRGASPGSRYAIALDRLTLQLLPMLNRVVAEQCGPDGFEGRGDLIVSPAVPGARGRAGTGVKPVAAVAAAPVAAPAASLHDEPVPGTAAGEPLAGASGYAGFVAKAPEDLAPAPTGLPALVLPCAHVLIVDQSAPARLQLCKAVESLGLMSSVAASAEDALSLCQTTHFDVVVTEVILPGMNGFRLTRELRHHHPGMPVIILSCKSSPLDLLRGALAGSAKYLTKPVKMFWFRKAIEQALQRSMQALPDASAAPAWAREESAEEPREEPREGGAEGATVSSFAGPGLIAASTTAALDEPGSQSEVAGLQYLATVP